MSTVHPMPRACPDRTAFWHDKRVIVTGGSGFAEPFASSKALLDPTARLIGGEGRMV